MSYLFKSTALSLFPPFQYVDYLEIVKEQFQANFGPFGDYRPWI